MPSVRGVGMYVSEEYNNQFTESIGDETDDMCFVSVAFQVGVSKEEL